MITIVTIIVDLSSISGALRQGSAMASPSSGPKKRLMLWS